MALDNSIVVSGNVTRDVELRYTTSGKAVTSMGMAISRRYQVNNEWQEQTTFLNVTAWGDLGEHVAASIHKGDRVMVAGRMDQREYEDKEGNKRQAFEITADDIGPSLKWAEATVQRISREDGGGSKKSTREDPVYGDEEPF